MGLHTGVPVDLGGLSQEATSVNPHLRDSAVGRSSLESLPTLTPVQSTLKLWLLSFLGHMFYVGEMGVTSAHPRADLAEALFPP